MKKIQIKFYHFFESLGIVPKIKNGYYYPSSESSITIWNALLYEAKKLKVKFITNLKVEEIKKEKHFIINPNKENIQTKN